jgi:hypothetical protein
MALVKALHGMRPWPDLGRHGGAHRRGERGGRGRERGRGHMAGRRKGWRGTMGALLGELGPMLVRAPLAAACVLCAGRRKEKRREEKRREEGEKGKRKKKKGKGKKGNGKFPNLKIFGEKNKRQFTKLV